MLRRSFPFFCYYINVKYHRTNNPLHNQFIQALLQDDWGVIKAFRGSAKTMYILYYEIWKGWTKKNQYQVYSSGNMDETKVGIRKCRRIIKKFSFLYDAIEQPHGLAKTEIEFENGSVISGRTYGSNMRGLGNEEVRITLFAGDDIYPDILRMKFENYELIWTEEIEHAIEPKSQLFLLGTPTDIHDLLAKCLASPLYPIKVVIPVLERDPITGQLYSVWESRFPLEYELRKQQYNPIAYARQMLVNPVPVEGIEFKTEWLPRFQDFSFTEKDMRFIWIDLAVSAEDTADYAGILDIYYRPPKFYINEAWGIRGIDDIGNHLKLLDEDKNSPPISEFLIEAPGSLHLLAKKDTNISKLGGRVLYKTSVSGQKVERIFLLKSWFIGGFVLVRENACGVLLTEYVGFPSAKHLHCLDALQMGIAEKSVSEHAWDWLDGL